MGVYILNLFIVKWDVTGTAWEVFTDEAQAQAWIDEHRVNDKFEFSVTNRYLECPMIDGVVYVPQQVEGCDQVGPGRWTVAF